jgi:hypothetical protein
MNFLIYKIVRAAKESATCFAGMLATQITNVSDQTREKNPNLFGIVDIDGFVLKIRIRSGSIFDDRGS